MNKDYGESITSSLQNIPAGKFVIECAASSEKQSTASDDHFHSEIDGKGRLLVYTLFPGTTISFSQFAADRAVIKHDGNEAVLKVSYCHSGRIGWNMKDNSVYLGSGDIVLHTMTCCAESEMTFPLGYYEGITIAANLDELAVNTPTLLTDGGFDANLLRDMFCTAPKPTVISYNQDIEHIFPLLYNLPKQQQLAYYKLKTLELLLYISRLHPESTQNTQYCTQQTNLIRQIHNQLTSDLHQRFTIEQLARQYLINSSSLKTIFKTVYGQPIATYMKEYRIRQSMHLLRATNDSIAAIAARVGYETQSKFTKAFKDITLLLPSEYRRQQ